MRTIAAAAVLVGATAPGFADEAQVDALWRALRFDDYAKVLSVEGVAYGKDIEDILFPGEGGQGWAVAVADIYAPDTMRGLLYDALHEQLDEKEVGTAVDFFASQTGARSVELELSARWALIDPDIEDGSVASMRQMESEGDPRIELIRKFSDANALVDNNVVSAMNGNYAFLSALAQAGQGLFVEDRAGILDAVWAQEPEIRADTEEWVLSFFTFAYSPLSDDEVRELIAFSETVEGRVLNEALFAAFDALFEDMSTRLGAAAAHYMEGERL